MNNIRIISAKNYDEMSRAGASIIAAHLALKPHSVIGMATGSTPMGIYQDLIRRYQRGELSFSQAKTVNLDEYVGLGANHDQSYRWFMNDNLFSKVDIKLENTYVPNGTASDLSQECKDYDRIIESLGGVDIQILGMGLNGHIAFNEPSDVFSKGTYCVELTESTIQANKRFFESEEDVPKTALTMGIRQIMAAKQILLLVSGKSKAEVLAKAIKGEITPTLTASVLQLHPNVVLIADEEALSCF